MLARVEGTGRRLAGVGLDRSVERVEIEGSGVRLQGDLHLPATDAPAAAFVVSHGWGSERPVDIPGALAAAGFPTLAYDLRGHGRSGGELATASRGDWLQDLVLVHFWLRGRFPDTPIALVGASFGGYLSLLALAHCDVAGISLRVPANYVDDGFLAPLLPRTAPGVRRREDLCPPDSAALRALREYAGPVQIVDADGDAAIPPQTIRDYVAAVDPARLTRGTLRDAPHHLATPELRAAYMDLLVGWATSTFRA